MTIGEIAGFCNRSLLRWTSHVLKRLFERNICLDDVKTVLMNGEIIEQYPDDYPFPSCLLLGYTSTGRPLHIVCGSNGTELWIITAYFPNPANWTDDFRQRRKV